MTQAISLIKRRASIWWSFASVQPKFFLQYTNWVYMELFTRTLGMAGITFFWYAVYASTTSISGMSLQQTINYILLAQLFSGLTGQSVMWWLGWSIREGAIAIDLLRPVDLQIQYYMQVVAQTWITFIFSIPLAIVALLFFGLQLPTNPLVWLCFLIAALLGQLVVFFFDWMIGCLAFYTTEVWGLGVMRNGIASFLSGAIVPLQMMPDWLRGLAAIFPFAQALYVPVSILSGATPLEQVPQLWAIQLLWILVLAVISRRVFNFTVRKVTVQGG
ncbi:MAG: ABC-2 family transporter protein [Anaerolineae bacterium]|nr:ABC-2 family transporter protein [Anaerolineae bacterium]